MTTVRLQTGLFVSAGSEPRTHPRGVFRSPGGTGRPDNAEAVDRCGGRKRISLTWCAGRSLSSHRIVHEARAEDVVRRVVRPPKVSNAVSCAVPCRNAKVSATIGVDPPDPPPTATHARRRSRAPTAPAPAPHGRAAHTGTAGGWHVRVRHGDGARHLLSQSCSRCAHSQGVLPELRPTNRAVKDISYRVWTLKKKRTGQTHQPILSG